MVVAVSRLSGERLEAEEDAQTLARKCVSNLAVGGVAMSNVVVRGARYDEEQAVCVMTAEGFNMRDRDCFRRTCEADPWHEPELHRICEVDGRIVSSVRIVRRWVRYGESILELGGIGDVTTLPEYRGRGYSTMVLQDALRWMKDHHCDFSLLFTGIPDFYRRVGYETIQQRCDVFPLEDGSPATPGVVVSEFDPARHLSGLMRLHETASHGRVGMMLRTPTYWKERLSRRTNSHGVLVATHRGRVTAYGVCEYGDDIELLECGHEQERFGDLCGVLAYIISYGKSRGAKRLHAWTGGQAHVRALLRSWLGNSELKPAYPMGQVVNLPQLLSRIQDELQVRLNASWLQGSVEPVRLKLDQDSVGIAVQGEAVALDPNLDCRQTLELQQKDALGLLFGEGVDTLGNRLETLADDTRALLGALFPPQEFAYSRVDGF